MRLQLQIEANEIEKVDSMTHYNHIMWRLKKPNAFGVTHVVESYDDVSAEPDYLMGHAPNGEWCCFAIGQGDPVPADKIGCGGVWINIDMMTIEPLIVNCFTLKSRRESTLSSKEDTE